MRECWKEGHVQKQGLPVSGAVRDLYASPKEAIFMLSTRLSFPQTSSSTSAFMETAFNTVSKERETEKKGTWPSMCYPLDSLGSIKMSRKGCFSSLERDGTHRLSLQCGQAMHLSWFGKRQGREKEILLNSMTTWLCIAWTWKIKFPKVSLWKMWTV